MATNKNEAIVIVSGGGTAFGASNGTYCVATGERVLTRQYEVRVKAVQSAPATDKHSLLAINKRFSGDVEVYKGDTKTIDRVSTAGRE